MKKIWQSNKYIPIFGYRFYYKLFFMYEIAKPLGLSIWKNWKNSRNVKNHKRRRLNGEPADKSWQKRRLKKLASMYGEKCVYCGINKDLTVDHIIELCISKNNALENTQIVCRKCHEYKTKIFNRRYCSKKISTGTYLHIVPPTW